MPRGLGGRRGRVLAGVVVAAAVIPGMLLAASFGGSGKPAPRLPDLLQKAPYQLAGNTVQTPAGRRFHLGFGSAVENVGAGPLVVDGRRPDQRRPTMRARQRIRWSNGSWSTRDAGGRLRYTRSPDHAHWHLLGFERYELLRLDGEVSGTRRDRKTGFCLGDRYEATQLVRRPGKPARAVYTGECGRGEPRRLSIREGISVGYGDDYDPLLEGQFVDITGLPSGRYELIHRVNAGRHLRESDYGNNAASIVLRLDWPGGPGASPRIDVVERCGDGVRCARG